MSFRFFALIFVTKMTASYASDVYDAPKLAKKYFIGKIEGIQGSSSSEKQQALNELLAEVAGNKDIDQQFRMETLGQLTIAGARTQTIDPDETTPVVAAFNSRTKEDEVIATIQFLVQHKADVSTESGLLKKTPLQLAQDKKFQNIAALLIDAKADPKYQPTLRCPLPVEEQAQYASALHTHGHLLKDDEKKSALSLFRSEDSATKSSAQKKKRHKKKQL